MTNGIDQGLGIEGKILHLVHEQPDNPAERNQEANDGLDKQQRGRQAAPPFAAGCQVTHLPPKQYVDRHGPQQAPDIGRQLDKNDGSQPQNNDEERITPVLFLDASHPPTVYFSIGCARNVPDTN